MRIDEKNSKRKALFFVHLERVKVVKYIILFGVVGGVAVLLKEVYSEPCLTSKMKVLIKTLKTIKC